MTTAVDRTKKPTQTPWARLALKVVTFTSACALILGVGCATSDSDDAVQGEVKMFIVDYEDGSHRVGYSLVTDDGEEFGLDFSTTPELRPGDRIKARGAFIDALSSLDTR